MLKTRGAFVTLLSRPSYLAGTLILDYTLKEVGSNYSLVVMVSSDLPEECLEVMALRNIKTILIERLAPKIEGTSIMDERFSDTWCKLAVFNLVQYERVVLLDSDMIVRKNIDELVEMPLRDGWIAAAHHINGGKDKSTLMQRSRMPENCAYSSSTYPPEIKEGCPRPYTLLNSGMVVLTPLTQTFNGIVHFLATSPLVENFQFPDQDLLAQFFREKWVPLDYTFNALKTLRVIHENLWRDDEVKCVHYILGDKPWKSRPKEGEQSRGLYYEVDKWWWDAFFRLEKDMKRVRTGEDGKAWRYIELHVAS